MSIGSNIKRIREAHGMTQEAFGKIAGVSSMAVSQWENDRAVPRMGAVQLIADYFKINKGEIIDDQPTRSALPPNAIPVRGSSAMVPVRVLGSTHAGERMDEDESDYEVEFPEGVVSRHPGCFAVRAEGGCMDKRYPHDCVIVIDPDAEPRVGDAVMARFPDGRSVVRAYMPGSSVLMLSPDSWSGEYDDIIVRADDDPVELAGVAVWYQAARDERRMQVVEEW